MWCPTEGSLLWQDTMAIPKGAPHPDNAHAFMNFVLDAEVGAQDRRDHPVCHRQRRSEEADGQGISRKSGDLPDRRRSSPNASPAIYLGEEGTKVRDEVWTRIQAA